MNLVGIDIGASKIAAGLVDVRSGHVLEETRVQTPVGQGAVAVLDACVHAAHTVAPEGAAGVGIGLCEYVDRTGRPVSAFTVDWRDLDVASAFDDSLGHVWIESDARAGALAESRFGAAAGHDPSVYVVVGTGISYALVIDGRPYAGARGNAIVVGAPPIEHTASGRALAEQAQARDAVEVLGDPRWRGLVESAAAELGLALAALVNALDPAIVVIGGGLGLVDTYRERVVAAALPWIEGPGTRDVAFVPARLGPRAGVIGAALAAADVFAAGVVLREPA